MKTKSLWKRIFGQPDKKVRAQAAFQEQFETKLQFRELEPRVVLDATALYNTDTGSLTIDIGDGETIDVGSTGAGSLFLNGLDGFKVTDGVTTTEIPLDGTAVGGVSFDAGVYTLSGISGLGQLTVLDSNDGSATSSKLQFLSLNEFGTLTITGNVFFQNVDNITFNNEANLSVTGSVHFIADSNADDTQVEIGSQISAVQVHVHNTGSPDFDFNMVSHADSELTALALTIYSNGGATSTVGIDLSKGLHYLDGIGMPMASGNDWISINEADGLALSELSLSSLTVVSGGTISDPTNTSIMVSGLTHLTATDIQLGASVGNSHDFNQLTLNASGNVEIHDATDGFDLVGTSEIGGSLALFAAGAVNQTSGTLAVDGTTEVMVSGGALVSLNQSGNELGGAVSVNSGTARAGLVHISDSTGDLVLGDIHATDLIADSQGAILQDAAGLDVLQTTALVAGDGSKITLDSSNNVLDGSISAKGQTGAAGAVTIHNTMATALASVHGATLAVHSAGTIQQQSGIIQAGTANFHAATGAAITLDKLNQIGKILAEGAAGSAAGDVVITNNGSLSLDTIHASTLTVTVQNGGDLTNTLDGDITVSGLTTLNATNITLGENSGNSHDFSTITLAATGNVTITDSVGNLTFVGDTNVGGNIVAKAIDGSILQAGGKLEVTGTSHFTAKNGESVTLNESNNMFGGSLSVTGDGGTAGAVHLQSGGTLHLDAIDATKLTVQASGVTQTATGLDVTTSTTITVDNGGTVDLDEVANTFGTLTVIGDGGAAGVVTLRSSGNLHLDDIDANILTARSASVSQTSTGLNISTSSTFTVDVAGDVDLAEAANQFGTLSVIGDGGLAGTVDLKASGNLHLDDISTAKLNIEAKGDVTQDVGAKLEVATTTLVEVSNGSDVILFNTGNDFGGAVSVLGIVDGTDTPDLVQLKDENALLLGDVVATELKIEAKGDVTQDVGAKLEVATTTLVEVSNGSDVILFNTGNDFGGAVSVLGIVDGTDTPDLVQLKDENALLLGDVVATELKIEAKGDVTQDVGAKLEVATTTLVEVSNGSDVILFNTGNDFGGAVSVLGIVDGTDTPDMVQLKDVNSIILGEISAASFQVVAGGDVTQLSSGEKLTVAGKTDIRLTGAGSVDLQYGANKLSNTVTLKLDDIAHLQNFHLRNEVASATTPSGDLAEALAIGNVNNLSFIFPEAGSLVLAEDPDGGGFDEIDILGNLYVELGGSLTQKGSIYVDGSAHFQAETINLAQTGNLDVGFDASFKATGGTIQVGVTTEAPEAFVRGTDSGQAVNFGTLNFEANGSHVTIAEDSKIDLVGQNKAKSLVLVSTTAGISDSAATSLTVSDLAAFKADVGDIILQQAVDLRIVYASATGDVAIIDSSLSDGLNVVDGTTANGGTLAIESNGHILQVNDFRDGAPVNAQIVADSAIFHSDKSVLLTDLKVSHLAGTAGGTINVSVNEAEIVSNALVNEEDGFGKILKIDAIDPLLPVAVGDPFAPQGPNPAGAISGAYSFVAVNNGSLTIENVVGVGGVSDHLGIKTEGQNTGHVFLRAKGAGANLDFKGSAGKENVIDLANSGILTALAEGELSIAANTELISRTGNVDGIVREIYRFEEQINSGNNPELGGGFGIVDDISFGPTYIRELASKDADHQDPNTTLFLRIVNGVDTKANVTLTQLGVDGEQDLQVTVNWGDETETFLFSDAIANEKLSHFFSDDFLALNPVFTVTVTAYNSPLINLYENVESGNGSPRSLNVIQDQILMKVIIAEIWVPEVTEFVPPTNPIPQMAPIVTYTVSQVTTQVEFTDDTRVATPIDGVSVVEVNRNDPDMAIGDEVQLGDEFMTLDAVKEQIQRDERFRPGLYRITILYPGVETPQVFLFEKQIRATPIDIFGNSTPRQPQQPQIDQVAEASQNATTAEEVWAREYEKWFPTVAIEYAGEDNLPERPEGLLPADDRQGRNPSDADVLLERVSLLDLQEIDRLSERLRAQRSIVRDSLNGALVGGAALMAAAAAQRRRDDVHFMAGEEPTHEIRGGSLERLRRRLKQWL